MNPSIPSLPSLAPAQRGAAKAHATPGALPREALADRVLACARGSEPQRGEQITAEVARWLQQASRHNPGPLEASLEGIASVLQQAQHLGMDAIPALRELVRQAGGERLPSATFRVVLLDIAERAGRLPAKALLSLCRGLALGASLRGEGRLLPPLLRDAALQVFSQVALPSTRRAAMAEALLLEPR